MTKSVTMCLAIPPNCQANVSLTKRNHLLAHKIFVAQSHLRSINPAAHMNFMDFIDFIELMEYEDL